METEEIKQNEQAQTAVTAGNGRLIGNIAVVLLRLVVGAVFVFSGFVKAVDPWGLVYKITEYAALVGLADWGAIITFAAFALPAIEFLLGVFVLLGLYRRLAPLLLMLLLAVLTPFTVYMAISGKVVECGCFGDAIALTNLQTVLKNVALIVATAFLVARNRRVNNLYSFAAQWVVCTLTMAFVLIVEYYGYVVQPMVDFRPYAVGSLLYDGPKVNGDDAGSEFVFVYSKNGVQREFTIDSLPDDDWQYVDRRVVGRSVAVQEETGVTIRQDGVDITPMLIDRDGEQLIFVFNDMEAVSVASTYFINELNEFARERGVSTFGVSASASEAVEQWYDLSMAQYKIYTMDDTQMRMLVRGNPALVYVRDGRVRWKRTLASLVNDRLQEPLSDMDSINADYNPQQMLHWLAALYVTIMILLLFVNRVYGVVKFCIASVKKYRKKDVTLQDRQQ